MAELSELEQKFMKADALAQQGDAQAKEDATLFASEIKRMRTPAPAAEPKGPGIAEKLIRGGLMGGPLGLMMAGGAAATHTIDSSVAKVAHDAGGKVTELASNAGMSPGWAAGVGTAANIATQAIPAVIGGKGAEVIASPGMQSAARGLMQSALKPILPALKQGKAERAIETMLDEGISLTVDGMTKLRLKINELNRDIASQIRDSTATFDKQAVYSSVKKSLDKFAMQATPQSDIAAIKTAWNNFLENPAFAKLGEKEAELTAKVAEKEAARNAALQDAGRFKTMEQQQQNLSVGGNVRLSPQQTANTPYMNVGATGERVVSPSAYPVASEPRFPARYTDNAQRVPEARSAYDDALAVVEQRRNELQKAAEDLAKHRAAGGSNVPVQLGQEMKQGTYARLGEKSYGELKGADTEAQKAIARGLKEQVAEAVPAIAKLNAKESELLNAMSVAERRVFMQANNNPLSLSLLAHNPKAWAAFMLDKSGPFKSMVARVLNAGHERIPQAVGSGITMLADGLPRGNSQ